MLNLTLVYGIKRKKKKIKKLNKKQTKKQYWYSLLIFKILRHNQIYLHLYKVYDFTDNKSKNNLMCKSNRILSLDFYSKNQSII